MMLCCVEQLHQHPHTRIECIPVPKEVDEDAPLYFRQALLEADETWSTHAKIIDLSKKPFRSAIPPVCAVLLPSPCLRRDQ